jgi:hypothetical protein
MGPPFAVSAAAGRLPSLSSLGEVTVIGSVSTTDRRRR